MDLSQIYHYSGDVFHKLVTFLMQVAIHSDIAVQLPECLVPVVVPDFLVPTVEVTNRAVGAAKAVQAGKADLLL
jgi:hypothetical protein